MYLIEFSLLRGMICYGRSLQQVVWDRYNRWCGILSLTLDGRLTQVPNRVTHVYDLHLYILHTDSLWSNYSNNAFMRWALVQKAVMLKLNLSY